jgi:hypothetical protein
MVVILLLSAAPVAGQTPAWTFDVTTASYAEAWEFNDSTEHFLGAQAGVDRRVWRGLAVRGEGLLLHVNQSGAQAWLRGLTLAMRARTHVRRMLAALDVGGGVSSSTTSVPPSGTTMNYLILLGGALEVPFARAYLSAGLRWFHVSNAGREGRLRNPDVQSLGGFAGVGWKF